MIDCAIGLSIGIIGAALLIAFASGVFFLLDLNPLIGVLALAPPAIFVFLSGFECARLGTHALELQRFSRSVVVVPWDNVTGIRETTRWEMLLSGAICPHRMCNMCLSFRDHFRIDWQDGYAYFAPRNPPQFLEALHELRRAALH
jgi:hypothetical protein